MLNFEVAKAGVAQLVEQLIRNQQVTRSSRVAGSNIPKKNIRSSLGDGRGVGPGDITETEAPTFVGKVPDQQT